MVCGLHAQERVQTDTADVAFDIESKNGNRLLASLEQTSRRLDRPRMGARVGLASVAFSMEHIGSDSQDENELLHLNVSASYEPSNLASGASAPRAIHGCPSVCALFEVVTKSGTTSLGPPAGESAVGPCMPHGP